jgi:hypothetical protein
MSCHVTAMVKMSLFLHRASTVRHATDTIVDDFTAEPRSRRPPGYGG